MKFISALIKSNNALCFANKDVSKVMSHTDLLVLLLNALDFSDSLRLIELLKKFDLNKEAVF